MRALCLLAFPIALALASCATAPATSGADERFKAHAARVLEEMWAEFPDFGIRNGYYKYADRMNVLDAARRDRTKAFYQRQLAALAQFEPSSLDASHRIELVIMKGLRLHGVYGRRIYDTWERTQSLLRGGLDVDPIITHRLDLAEWPVAFDLIASRHAGKVVLLP